MDGLLLLLVFALLVFAIVLARPTKTIVFEFERGLKFRRGRFKGVLVLGMPSGATPIPLRDRPEPELPPAADESAPRE